MPIFRLPKPLSGSASVGSTRVAPPALQILICTFRPAAELMEAVRVLAYGSPPVLAEMPTPGIADDEGLVRVRSTAVNHLDLVEASGSAKEMFPIDLPWTPGHEFSGVVERVGKEVVGVAVRDPVFGNSGSGAYAE